MDAAPHMLCSQISAAHYGASSLSTWLAPASLFLPPCRQLEFEFCAPRPIVKWPGGKGRLLDQLLPLLPGDVEERRYIEPFAGGAALYFRLTPSRALIRDSNRQLIETYRCVQREVEALIDALRRLERTHNAEQYYRVRQLYNETPQNAELVERCAQFIYLNKTGYNGLHRVNRRGEFNVPVGRAGTGAARIVDAPGLRAANQALQGVTLLCASFETVLDVALPGDFLYFDPPYDIEPGSKQFTSYAGAFGEAEQDALTDVFRTLDRRGCKLMVSNSATPANRSRYASFHITEVEAPRSINCRGAGRRAVTELVVRNYV